MTIKQHGGIFGRNPTFNNVTVDGTLAVDQIVEKTGAAGITLDGVTLKDGNVVLANGKGIDFSATAGTGTSELFDDYEEGTWTPELRFGAANTGIVQTTEGYYTKVGRIVTLSFRIALTSKGTATGSATITGVPFSAAVGGSGVMGYNLFWTSYPANGIFLNIFSSNNYLSVGINANGGSASDANFANNTQMNNVTVTYLAG